MTGFDADWLARREPFDAQARNPALAAGFARSLRGARGNARQDGAWRVIDLAAGTGSNFRALAPLLGGDQEWLLVDHDPILRAAQAGAIAQWAERAGGSCHVMGDTVVVQAGAVCWRARAHALDLANSLDALDFAAFDAVTTAAFLDLVSADWLDRLVDRLTLARRPLLAVLTVDGRRRWSPMVSADQRLHDAFRRHQAGDKGFGPALGSDATAALECRLVARGFAVSTAPSDWRIGPPHGEMLWRMVDEANAVACQSEASAAAIFGDWRAQRIVQIQDGRLSLEVGHQDLLALPADTVGESPQSVRLS